MNTTAPPDTTGGAHLTPHTLTGDDPIPLTPNVAQHWLGKRQDVNIPAGPSPRDRGSSPWRGIHDQRL